MITYFYGFPDSMKSNSFLLTDLKLNIFLSNVRTFMRCLKLTALLTMLSFTILSFILFNESIEKLAIIISGGALIAIISALSIATWYRTSIYQVKTAKRTEFIEALYRSIRLNHLEMESVTSDLIMVKSQVKNIFHSNEHEIIIHINSNDFQIEGYDFLIKRLMKKFPSGIIDNFIKC